MNRAGIMLGGDDDDGLSMMSSWYPFLLQKKLGEKRFLQRARERREVGPRYRRPGKMRK